MDKSPSTKDVGIVCDYLIEHVIPEFKDRAAAGVAFMGVGLAMLLATENIEALKHAVNATNATIKNHMKGVS